MTRRCRACEGFGTVSTGNYPSLYLPCLSCQGAGTVPEPTEAEKRRDAMADAETLCGEWDATSKEYDVPSRFRLSRVVVARLWQAGILGNYIPHECYDSAAEAARAAFRAVPGLRGER